MECRHPARQLRPWPSPPQCPACGRARAIHHLKLGSMAPSYPKLCRADQHDVHTREGASQAGSPRRKAGIALLVWFCVRTPVLPRALRVGQRPNCSLASLTLRQRRMTRMTPSISLAPADYETSACTLARERRDRSLTPSIPRHRAGRQGKAWWPTATMTQSWPRSWPRRWTRTPARTPTPRPASWAPCCRRASRCVRRLRIIAHVGF